MNVLQDPWIPLATGDPARLPDLLCGAADAAQLAHPRPELGVYARVLLSTLAQTFFPVEDAAHLRERIRQPLPRREVEAALAEAAPDFGVPGSFLQEPERAPGENQTGRLFFGTARGTRALLNAARQPFEAVCPPCALLGLVGAQAFAMPDGAGYFSGITGRPSLTTLVTLPSVRQSVWANVLTQETLAGLGYAADTATPWRQEARRALGSEIGLLEGLYWQPRAVRLDEAKAGMCASCGATGSRVAVMGFAPKSKAEAGYCHPYVPRLGAQHVALADRPAVWTAVADALAPELRQERGSPAPVVRQWLAIGERRFGLSLFGVRNNKAALLGLLATTVQLDLPHDLEPALDALAARRWAAILSARTLARDLASAGMGGLWTEDALQEFWRDTDTLAESCGDDLEAFRSGLGRASLRIYGSHVSNLADPTRATKPSPTEPPESLGGLTAADLRGLRERYDRLRLSERTLLERARSVGAVMQQPPFWRLVDPLVHGDAAPDARRLAHVVLAFRCAAQGQAGLRELLRAMPKRAPQRLIRAMTRQELAEGLVRYTPPRARVDWGELGLDVYGWGSVTRARWAALTAARPARRPA